MNDELNRIRRLHIGGREVKEGWEILDALPADYVNHLGDATDLSYFPDCTFAEIYASHVLEHFDYKDELARVLREWRRVLIPAGRLYISVPDMERLCHMYLTPRLGRDVRIQIMRMLFGGHMDQYDYHQVGLDQGHLTHLLQVAGFHSIERVQNFDLFRRDSSSMEMLGMPISCNMIATR